MVYVSVHGINATLTFRPTIANIFQYESAVGYIVVCSFAVNYVGLIETDEVPEFPYKLLQKWWI